MTKWNEVQRGYVVADKAGRHWTVMSRTGSRFTISSPGRPDWSGEMAGDVTVVSRPVGTSGQADGLDDIVAKGIIATKFGGVEIGKQGKNRKGPWYTPVEFVDPGSMLAHLRIFHAKTSDEPSLTGLIAEHAALHGPNEKASALYEPHVHDPAYEEK